MPRANHFGPSILVLLTIGAVLFAAPAAIKSVVRARAEVDVRQAVGRLAQENILEQFSAATRDIAVIVEPSVVHVSTAGRLPSTGSGWLWDQDGHVITNAHVVGGADRIEVQLFDGEVRPAEVVGLDLRSDIAVLKVPEGNLIPARRGDSLETQQGDLVFAFGSPFDFRFSMSSGIVSGIGRAAGLDEIDYENFIQVDAAINPGNSGGPLSDVYGRVIGMNTAIATGRGSTVGKGQFGGIGLAIPMSMIESVVEQVIETGVVRKGFMGVSLREARSVGQLMYDARMDQDLATRVEAIAEFYEGEGVVITSVSDGSPADQAGFLGGDVIERIEGRKVRGLEQLKSMISSRKPGEKTAVSIWRWDPSDEVAERIVLDIVLGELRSEDVSMAAGILQRFGLLKLEQSTKAAARRMGVDYVRGVLVVDSNPESALGDVFPKGSIITRVGNNPVRSVDEVLARIDRVLTANRRFRAPEGGLVITAILPSGEEVVFDLANL